MVVKNRFFKDLCEKFQFHKLEYILNLSLKIQKYYSSNLRKIVAMSLSNIGQVLACKETSYVKVSNVYKWCTFTLHIIPVLCD